MDRLDPKSLERLYETILSLRTVEECYAFFDDLCTIKERKDLAQRLDVAFLLDRGLNYQAVASETGVSSATICRVIASTFSAEAGSSAAVCSSNSSRLGGLKVAIISVSA